MSDSDETPDRLGWTPQMVFYNTVGTIIGGVAGVAALVIALVALIK